MKSRKDIAPDYPRIPHLVGVSNLYDDDIEVDVEFGKDGYVQEKVDGANSGVSWMDGPILRNRKHILHKGYMKDTPAKKQFVPMWNWLHEREDDLKEIMKRWQGQVTVYGEWLLAKHSLEYNKLPDFFLAYDVWSCEDNKFISPSKLKELFKGTKITYITPEKIRLNTFGDIKEVLDRPSIYRNGIREGVVIKLPDATDAWIDSMFKVVRADFKRDDKWVEKNITKNKILK